MLASRDIISAEDLAEIERGLSAIKAEIDDDTFRVEPGDEDIHMAIERRLIALIGPVGGKLHTARSRNDQVATDVALFVRAHTLEAKDNLLALMEVLSSGQRSTSTGGCRRTRTCSGPSPSTSCTTCPRTSGSSAATSSASTS